MKIIKDYETIINLSAIEMYSDIDKIILDKLRQRFENKCEKNSLIIKVLNIVKRSKCNLSKSRLDGSADVNVQFRADAIIYNNDDILTGCEVQKIDRGSNILCKHEVAIINIKGNRNLHSLKTGQKITIKISSISYPKGYGKITIYGMPYSYSYKFMMYYTSLESIKLTDNIILLKNKLKDIDDELKIHNQLDKNSLKFFNNIFYPFKDSFDDKMSILKKSKIEILNMYDLASSLIKPDTPQRDIYLIRHTIIDKSTPFIISIIESDLKSGIVDILDPKLYEIEIVKENIFIVLYQFLNDYLSHLKIIREMTQIYTESEIDTHNNIWNIYNKLKK